MVRNCTQSALSASTGRSVAAKPGSRRGSLSGVAISMPGPMSPGPILSSHGTQAGASSAAEPGSRTTSLTVASLAREARTSVTAQCQSA